MRIFTRHRRKYILASLVFLLASFWLIRPSATAAVNTTLPYQPDFTEWNSSLVTNDMYLSVAAAGANYKLDAPVSTVKIYVPASFNGTLGIRVLNAAWCPNDFNGGPDSLLTRTYPNTSFIVYEGNSNESQGVPITFFGTDSLFNGIDPCPSNPGPDGIDNASKQRDALLRINMSGRPVSTVVGHTAWKVLYFRASNNGGFTDGINMFQLRVDSGAQIGYYSGSLQDNKFAIGQGWIQPPRWADYHIEFAPNCTTPTNTSSTISWFDADAGQTNQTIPGTSTPTTITTQLVEYVVSTGAATGRTWNFNLTGGQGVSGSFSFLVRNGHRYRWTIQNVDSRNGVQFKLPYDSFNLLQDCTPPPPGPTVSCTSSLSNPSPEPGTNFTSTVSISNTPSTATTYTGGTATLSISPAVTSGGSQSFGVPSVSGGSSTNITSGNIRADNVGTYTLTWTISGGNGGTHTCTSTFTIVHKPFFRVREGDISAGMDTCDNSGWRYTTPTAGVLSSWNNGQSGASNTGAGTNLATFALDIITEVASAQEISGSTAPLELSFANATGPYGGEFGGVISCPSDYYGKYSPLISSSIASSSTTVPNDDNVRLRTGDLTINASSISLGNRPVILVNGNVRITGNITLAGGAGSITQLPNFMLVVKGNIYIQDNVAQLDGIYVAQPTTDTNGKIYTCTDSAANSPPSKTQLNAACHNNQLTVNGSFIAKELKLYRTLGGLNSGTPGEIFNYTPTVWLAEPGSAGGSDLNDRYDAITSLPPIL